MYIKVQSIDRAVLQNYEFYKKHLKLKASYVQSHDSPHAPVNWNSTITLLSLLESLASTKFLLEFLTNFKIKGDFLHFFFKQSRQSQGHTINLQGYKKKTRITNSVCCRFSETVVNNATLHSAPLRSPGVPSTVTRVPTSSTVHTSPQADLEVSSNTAI